MSLRLLPDNKTFYLLPLDKELPTPRELLSDLEKAEVRTLLRTLFCFKVRACEKHPCLILSGGSDVVCAQSCRSLTKISARLVLLSTSGQWAVK